MLVVGLSFWIVGQRLLGNHRDEAEGTILSNVRVLNEHHGQVWYFTFSPDGKILACCNSNFTNVTPSTPSGVSESIVVWEIATGKKLASIDDVSNGRALAFAPDGKTLATPHGDSIGLWDTATWKNTPKRLKPHTGGPVSWLNGKTLALWEHDPNLPIRNRECLRIWNLETAKPGVHFASGPASITDMAFSSDGKYFAIVDVIERQVQVWDVATGEMVWSVVAHINKWGGGSPNCLAFAPGAKQLASAGGDHAVRIWDVASGREIESYPVFRSATSSVAFSPDGKLLAAGDDAQPELPCQVLVWDVKTGERLGIWKTRLGVRQLGFSPDGKTLAVAQAHEPGGVELWSVEEMLGKKVEEDNRTR
jgi:WD40 repeat protein